MDELFFFPNQLPDETLYSLAVRYHRLAGNKSYRLTSQELFGKYSRTCGSTLPCCLDSLSLRVRGIYSSQELIDRTTLLPLYLPFATPSIRDSSLLAMRGKCGSGLKMSLGMTASGLLKYASFRYCTSCLEDDAAKYGVAYWHRIHQAPGVCVCPLHENILRATKFPCLMDWRCMKLPGEAVGMPVFEHSPIAPALEIAKMQMWALESPAKVGEIIKNKLVEYCLAELKIQVSGRLDIERLVSFFQDKVKLSPDEMEFESVTANHKWVLSLLRPRERMIQPFRYYFLCWMLGVDREKLGWYISSGKKVKHHKASPKIISYLPPTSEVDFRRSSFVSDQCLKLRERRDYSWLSRHDRQWLSGYVATHPSYKVHSARVNWGERDRILSRSLVVARNKILRNDGMPIRITRRALINNLKCNFRFCLMRRMQNLPESLNVLEECIESAHDYQFRKLSWMVEKNYFLESSALSVMLKLAGIRVLKLSESEISQILVGNKNGLKL